MDRSPLLSASYCLLKSPVDLIRRAAALKKSDRPVRVDSDIERPVSATSRYGRSAVRLVDMKNALPVSVIGRHSNYDVLGSRNLVRPLRTLSEDAALGTTCKMLIDCKRGAMRNLGAT
jgi:hypothetical protein